MQISGSQAVTGSHQVWFWAAEVACLLQGARAARSFIAALLATTPYKSDETGTIIVGWEVHSQLLCNTVPSSVCDCYKSNKLNSSNRLSIPPKRYKSVERKELQTAEWHPYRLPLANKTGRFEAMPNCTDCHEHDSS